MEAETEQVAYLRALLNAIPSQVLVVDDDMVVQDCNISAAKLTDGNTVGILNRHCGDVLHCMFERRSDKRCGQTDACPTCPVRNAAARALSEKQAVLVKAPMQVDTDEGPRSVVLLVSAAPLSRDGRDLLVLTIEDITEVEQLRELIPVCAWCKKVRTDDEYWEDVATFIARYTNSRITHGICPDCRERMETADPDG